MYYSGNLDRHCTGSQLVERSNGIVQSLNGIFLKRLRGGMPPQFITPFRSSDAHEHHATLLGPPLGPGQEQLLVVRRHCGAQALHCPPPWLGDYNVAVRRSFVLHACWRKRGLAGRQHRPVPLKASFENMFESEL